MNAERDKKLIVQTKRTGFMDLLNAFSHEDPDRTAVLYEKRGIVTALSRSAFAEAVMERKDDLAEEFGAGTCLGVLCDGSLSCVLTIFAAVLAGLQIVLLDENASEDLLAAQIRQTDIDCLWGSDDDLIEELQSCLTEGLSPQRDMTDARSLHPAQIRTPDEHPILFFTSGTTSSSKAVVLTDASLMAAAYNGSCKLPLSCEDTLLCMLPLNHVFGFVCGMLWGMQCGAAVALGRGARYYTQDLSFFRPTALSAVPMLLGFLLQHNLLNEELRLILIGAGDCPPALLAAAAAKGVSVSFGYGLTETSSGVAISVPPEYRVNPVCTPDPGDPACAPDPGGPAFAGPDACGRALEGAQSFDPYALEICPENTVTLADDSEILVTGASCMMKGYYKQPEDTAAVLKDGVLYTGDLGRWDEDGRLHIIGRKKEILVLHDGTKLFLPEYESRIAAVLPGRDFAVLEKNGRPVLLLVDPDAGSEGGSGTAADKARASILETIRPVMAELPRGQQISAVLFTSRPLPRTATGKVKRWELARQLPG